MSMKVSIIFEAVNKMTSVAKRVKDSMVGITRTQERATGSARGLTVEIDRKTTAMARQIAQARRLSDAHERMNKSMASAAAIGIAGQSAGRVAAQSRRFVASMTGSYREVARASGDLATLGVEDIDSIVRKGQEMQTRFAGITADAFVSAAYDVRSGIASLSDLGVADVTAAAALTARATKASVEQMTSLFATGHGIFKRLYAEADDGDFADIFGAQLSAAVKVFKTTGAQMQAAIENAGAGATLLNMSMEEQLAILGELQKTRSGAEAGTMMAAFTRDAAKAHEAFAEMGRAIELLDEDGGLRDMSDILADFRAEYGETLNAYQQREIQEAFGRAEAARMVQLLWGQEEATRANAAALRGAGEDGAAFVEAMAGMRQQNLDAQLALLAQRFDILRQKVAARMEPALAAFARTASRAASAVTRLVERFPRATAVFGVGLLVVAGLATGLAGVLTVTSALIGALAMLRFALTWTSVKMMLLSARTALAGASLKGFTAWTVLASKALLGKLGGALKVAAAGSGALLTPLKLLALKWIPAAALAVKALGAALLFTPVGWVLGAVALIAGAAWLLWRNWDSVAASWRLLWNDFPAAAEKGWERLRSIISWTPAYQLTRLWWPPLRWLGNLFGHPVTFLRDSWERLRSVLSWSPLDTLQGAWGGVAEWMQGAVAAVAAPFEALTAQIERLRNLGGSAGRRVRQALGIGEDAGDEAGPDFSLRRYPGSDSGGGGGEPAVVMAGAGDMAVHATFNIHAAAGDKGMDIAAQVRGQFEALMREFRREQEQRARGALHD